MATVLPLRERRKEETRQIIINSMIDCLDRHGLEGLTYACIAAQAGVTERTVYRYFPTRDDLLRGLWEWLSTRGGPQIGMPKSEAALTDNLKPLFTGFDSVASLMRAVMLSSWGGDLRSSMRERRVEAFTATTADAATGLPPADKRKAAAIIQLLHSGYAWLEMHQSWGLDGNEAAEASAWAIRTLLADLRRRKGRPLSEGPAEQMSEAEVVDR